MTVRFEFEVEGTVYNGRGKRLDEAVYHAVQCYARMEQFETLSDAVGMLIDKGVLPENVATVVELGAPHQRNIHRLYAQRIYEVLNSLERVGGSLACSGKFDHAFNYTVQPVGEIADNRNAFVVEYWRDGDWRRNRETYRTVTGFKLAYRIP